MTTNEITLDQLSAEMFSLIADRLGLKSNTLSLDNDLARDLGADSLDTVELIMDIEHRFGVRISDEDAVRIQTINDAVQHVFNSLTKEQ